MKKDKVLIIGAGLCGTLLAIRMAQKGHEVILCEKRPDMRKADISAGRSINLALSNRGLKALRMIGLEQKVLEECIPMKGRMIHTQEGDLRFSSYSGREGEHINSVPRGGLNITLLDQAEKFENITLHFNQICTKVDLDNATATFKDYQTGEEQTIEAAVILGTDGAGSSVRKSMEQNAKFNAQISQEFLSHGYKELNIPPGENDSFQIEKNALHIWPRGSYMVIALPNLDGSFTVTAFFPMTGNNGFDQLDTKEKVRSFFEEHFPDLVPFVPALEEDYFSNPVGKLGTIKCYPWQANGKVLLLGDAAHAIVPFYGQGMNASFEDVVVFDALYDEYQGDWSKLLPAYEEVRKTDADAIAELALDNFHEMQDHVADPIFVKKRQLEMQLEQQFPEYYSKYSMVTFNENLSYRQAKELGRRQDELLMEICSKTDLETLDLEVVLQQVAELSAS